jgi:hypothetical protein
MTEKTGSTRSSMRAEEMETGVDDWLLKQMNILWNGEQYDYSYGSYYLSPEFYRRHELPAWRIID